MLENCGSRLCGIALRTQRAFQSLRSAFDVRLRISRARSGTPAATSDVCDCVPISPVRRALLERYWSRTHRERNHSEHTHTKAFFTTHALRTRNMNRNLMLLERSSSSSSLANNKKYARRACDVVVGVVVVVVAEYPLSESTLTTSAARLTKAATKPTGVIICIILSLSLSFAPRHT